MGFDDHLKSLTQKRNNLLIVKKSMDKNAPMHSGEGFAYAMVLTKLILINLEIESEHEKRCSGKHPLVKLTNISLQ